MVRLISLIILLTASSCATKPPPLEKLTECTFATYSVEHPDGGLWCAERILNGPPATQARFVEFKTAVANGYIAMPSDSHEQLLRR